MDHKSVDINQRIPLDVLEVALISFLNEDYSNDYIKEQLSLEFTGQNRVNKSLRIVNKIIPRNPLNQFVLAHKKEVLTALKSKADKNILLISLLNAAFIFSFDVFSLFGKFLGIQEEISGEAMMKSVRSVFGGNRAPEIGFYAVVPMFVEAGILSRPKSGIYSVENKLKPRMDISWKLLRESFKHQKGVSEWTDFHEGDPYFNLISR